MIIYSPAEKVLYIVLLQEASIPPVSEFMKKLWYEKIRRESLLKLRLLTYDSMRTTLDQNHMKYHCKWSTVVPIESYTFYSSKLTSKQRRNAKSKHACAPCTDTWMRLPNTKLTKKTYYIFSNVSVKLYRTDHQHQSAPVTSVMLFSGLGRTIAKNFSKLMDNRVINITKNYKSYFNVLSTSPSES
jgi:hypothetical protein